MRDQGLNVVVDPVPPEATQGTQSDEDPSDDSSDEGGSDADDSGEDRTTVNGDESCSECTLSRYVIYHMFILICLIDI